MIHVFKQDGIGIALDVNSGAVHVLDPVAMDILACCQTEQELEDAIRRQEGHHSADALEGAREEILTLIREGTLFSASPDLSRFEGQDGDPLDLKALCLHMAHDCNLRCDYCFADKGAYRGKLALMSSGTACRAVDLLLDHSTRKHVEIDFFGGEPLLNFPAVKETVEYALRRQGDRVVHFTLTTNATILNEEILGFLNRHMDNLVFSLDGRKEVHDRMRKFADGGGTYDIVLKNIRRILDARSRGTYFIRGTFTPENLDFSRDAAHIRSLGFREISLEPVKGIGYAFTPKQQDAVLKEYEEYAAGYALEADYRFYHFHLDLYRGPCVLKRIRGCGAGFEYAAVTPDGNLFACHQLAGLEEFCLGNVRDGFRNMPLTDRMRKVSVMSKETCRECWAKFFCSGGCHASAFYRNRNIMIPDDQDCVFQKKRIECALVIEARRRIGHA